MENGTQFNVADNSAIHSAVAITLLTVSVIVLVENILTVVSILCYGKRRDAPDVWVCSLSMVDILQACIPSTMILYMYLSDSEAFHNSPGLCKAQGWFLVSLRIISCSTVAFMSFNQFIKHLLRPAIHEKWKQSHSAIIVILIWIFSAFVASLPLIGLGEIRPLKDVENLYCLFQSETEFGVFLFSLMFLLMIFTFCCVFTLVVVKPFFAPANLSSISDKKITGYGRRSLKLIQERQSRAITRMVAVVSSFFYVCLLPRMVSLILDLVSVHTPGIYGLFSLQLPLLSGIINPLIYAIMWKPYRRGYIRVLTCSGHTGFRLIKRSPHSGSHTLNGPSLTRHQSFWSADFLKDERPRAFDILFGPSPVFKPLNFNNDELQLFDASQSTILFDESTNSSTAIRQDELMLDNSIQFQSILDLIDEMAYKSTKIPNDNYADNASGILKKDEPNSVSVMSFWSTDERNSSSLSGETSTTLDEVQLSIMPDFSQIEKCPEHHGGSVTSSTIGCMCLGRSKTYQVENSKRYLDYLVAKEVKEGTDSKEEVIVIEV